MPRCNIKKTHRRDRRGMSMMMVMLVVVMLLALLMAFTLNTSFQVTRAPEKCTVGDELAATAAKVKANNMNALTLAQHQIGEVLAFLMTHHGLGGDLLDQQKKAEKHAKKEKRDELNDLNEQLDNAKEAAQGLGASTPAYDTVRQKEGIKAEATLLDAKMKLKEYLIMVYWQKVAAKLMQMYPPTAAAGRALEEAMDAFEEIIEEEYEFLNRVEQAAVELLPLKEDLRHEALPYMKEYTISIVDMTPSIVNALVHDRAMERGAIESFVVDASLSVQIDPLSQAMTLPENRGLREEDPHCCPCRSINTDITRDQINKVTQLSRASFPWVVYHRLPILRLLNAARLSKARALYKDYSDGASKQLSNRYQMDGIKKRNGEIIRLGLYVNRDYSAPDQGYGLWADSPRLAHELFATTVAVLMPPTGVIGAPAVFEQHHPDGHIYFAQGLIYNANNNDRHKRRINLTCKRITPNRQADFGTNTLNWYTEKVAADGLAATPWELVAVTDLGGAPSPDYPTYRLNWQSRLEHTPVEAIDRLRDAPGIPQAMRSNITQLLDETDPALISH